MWTLCTAFLTLSTLVWSHSKWTHSILNVYVLRSVNYAREDSCHLKSDLCYVKGSWLLLFMRWAAGCCFQIPADLRMQSLSCLSSQCSEMFQRSCCTFCWRGSSVCCSKWRERHPCQVCPLTQTHFVSGGQNTTVKKRVVVFYLGGGTC